MKCVKLEVVNLVVRRQLWRTPRAGLTSLLSGMPLLLVNVSCSVLQDCIQGYEWSTQQSPSAGAMRLNGEHSVLYYCIRLLSALSCCKWRVTLDTGVNLPVLCDHLLNGCISVLQGRCSGQSSGTLEAVLPKVTLVLCSWVCLSCRAAPVGSWNNLYECYFMNSRKTHAPSTKKCWNFILQLLERAVQYASLKYWFSGWTLLLFVIDVW